MNSNSKISKFSKIRFLKALAGAFFCLMLLFTISCGNSFLVKHKKSNTTDVQIRLPASLFNAIAASRAAEGETDAIENQDVSVIIYLYVNKDQRLEKSIDHFNKTTGEIITFPEIEIGAKVQAGGLIRIGEKEYSGISDEAEVTEEGANLALQLDLTKLYWTLGIQDAIEQIKTLRHSCDLKITGAIDSNQMNALSEAASDLALNIQINLDISETTGLTEFAGYTQRIVSYKLPKSINSFTSWAFNTYFKELSFPDGNENFVVEDSRILYSKDKTTMYRFFPENSDTKFEIPANVKTIGSSCFYMCDRLEEITIPATVESLGYTPFMYCHNLKKLTVAEGNQNYKTEDNVLFTADGKELIQYVLSKPQTEYTIPDTVITIENNAFSDAKNLKTLTIPASVKEIGAFVFFGVSIEELNFADKEFWVISEYNEMISEDALTNINNYKNWDGDVRLVNQWIRKSNVETIAANKLYETIDAVTADQKVIFKVTGEISNEDFRKVCELLHNKNNNEWKWGRYVSLDLQEVTGLTKINYSLFVPYFGIPASVQEISEDAFSDMTNGTVKLNPENKSFVMDDGVLYDKDKTLLLKYSSSKKDKTFAIPDTVKRVYENAFSNHYFEELIIPKNVEQFGTENPGRVIDNCASLKKITVAEDNKNYISVDGVLFSKDKTKMIKYPRSKPDADYTIPEGTKIICSGAISNCFNIKNLVIPKSVEIIENGAISWNEFETITFEDPENWYKGWKENQGSQGYVSAAELQNPLNYRSEGTVNLRNYYLTKLDTSDLPSLKVEATKDGNKITLERMPEGETIWVNINMVEGRTKTIFRIDKSKASYELLDSYVNVGEERTYSLYFNSNGFVPPAVTVTSVGGKDCKLSAQATSNGIQLTRICPVTYFYLSRYRLNENGGIVARANIYYQGESELKTISDIFVDPQNEYYYMSESNIPTNIENVTYWATSNVCVVKATAGVGEPIITNEPKATIENNQFNFSVEPKLNIADSVLENYNVGVGFDYRYYFENGNGWNGIGLLYNPSNKDNQLWVFNDSYYKGKTLVPVSDEVFTRDGYRKYYVSLYKNDINLSYEFSDWETNVNLSGMPQEIEIPGNPKLFDLYYCNIHLNADGEFDVTQDEFIKDMQNNGLIETTDYTVNGNEIYFTRSGLKKMIETSYNTDSSGNKEYGVAIVVYNNQCINMVSQKEKDAFANMLEYKTDYYLTEANLVIELTESGYKKVDEYYENQGKEENNTGNGGNGATEIADNSPCCIYYDDILLGGGEENSYNYSEMLEMFTTYLGCKEKTDFTITSTETMAKIILTDSGLEKFWGAGSGEEENPDGEPTVNVAIGAYQNRLVGFISNKMMEPIEKTFIKDTDYTITNNGKVVRFTKSGYRKFYPNTEALGFHEGILMVSALEKTDTLKIEDDMSESQIIKLGQELKKLDSSYSITLDLSEVKRLETIPKQTFQNANCLSVVKLPESVTSIGQNAFSGCYFTTIELPSSLVTIDAYAFCDSGLSRITIPASVTTIGDYAFGNTSLASINVEEGNKNFKIVDGVLFNIDTTDLIMYPVKSSTTSYTVPNTVKVILSGAFNNSNLETITLNEGLETLGQDCFSRSRQLKTIQIPSTVTNIQGQIIKYCTNLESITVAIGNTKYAAEEGVLYALDDNGNKVTIIVYPPKKSSESFVIPETVEKLEFASFWAAPLKTISIPNSVTKIYSYAFVESSLESISFVNKNGWKVGNEEISTEDLENVENYIKWNSKLSRMITRS